MGLKKPKIQVYPRPPNTVKPPLLLGPGNPASSHVGSNTEVQQHQRKAAAHQEKHGIPAIVALVEIAPCVETDNNSQNKEDKSDDLVPQHS
jgi:hypothetical protein